MKSSLDIRELRSFKLCYSLESYCDLLKNSENTSAFFVADSLYPDERISLTESFLNQDLKVTMIPKNLNRIVFRSKDVESASLIRNLLRGHIFLIKSTKSEFLTKEKLKYLLFSTKFFLRAILSHKK